MIEGFFLDGVDGHGGGASVIFGHEAATVISADAADACFSIFQAAGMRAESAADCVSVPVPVFGSMCDHYSLRNTVLNLDCRSVSSTRSLYFILRSSSDSNMRVRTRSTETSSTIQLYIVMGVP